MQGLDLRLPVTDQFTLGRSNLLYILFNLRGLRVSADAPGQFLIVRRHRRAGLLRPHLLRHGHQLSRRHGLQLRLTLGRPELLLHLCAMGTCCCSSGVATTARV